MVKFYFEKFRVTIFFIVFLLASILNVGIVIISAINGSLVMPELLLSPVPVLGLVGYWKYLKAVYNNIPALIVEHDSIYIFDINQTLLWKDIESYKPERYIDDRILSIKLKLADPKSFIPSIKNSLIKSIYQSRYFLFRRIIIRVQTSLLEDSPEVILKKIDAVTNNS